MGSYSDGLLGEIEVLQRENELLRKQVERGWDDCRDARNVARKLLGVVVSALHSKQSDQEVPTDIRRSWIEGWPWLEDE